MKRCQSAFETAKFEVDVYRMQQTCVAAQNDIVSVNVFNNERSCFAPMNIKFVG